MVDINEAVGKASCSSVQQDYSPSDVMFTTVDVTKSDQLVTTFLS